MRPSRRLCIAGCLLASARGATAAPTTVYVPPSACGARPVDLDAFIAALRVELGAAGMTIDAAPSPRGLALAVEAVPCDALSSAVEITVIDASGDRHSRTVSLVDVPASTRPRTVALASAELIAEAGQAAEATGAAAAPPSPTDVPPTMPAPAPSVPNLAPPPPVVMQTPSPLPVPVENRPAVGSVHPLLGVGGEYRRYLGPGTTVYGLRVVTEWPLPLRHVIARVDAQAGLGSSPSPLGAVTLRTLAGAAGAEWSSAGDDFELAIGVLAEAGYANAYGQTTPLVAATPRGAATAAVGAVASMRGRIGWRIWAALEVTAGVELAGLRAHVEDVTRPDTPVVVGGVEGGFIGARFVAAYGR